MTPAKPLKNIAHNLPEENNTSTYLSDPNIAVADHAYFTLTNENTTIAKNCLVDEFDETLDNELDTSDDIENVLVEEQ